MSLDNAMKNMKFDLRLIEFNIRTGQLTKEEVQKYLQSLPDSSANSEKLDIEENSSSSEEQH